MNIYVRSLLSLATLALVTLVGRSLQQTTLTWSVLAVIVLIYLVMIWVRQSWWTRTNMRCLCACSWRSRSSFTCSMAGIAMPGVFSSLLSCSWQGNSSSTIVNSPQYWQF